MIGIEQLSGERLVLLIVAIVFVWYVIYSIRKTAKADKVHKINTRLIEFYTCNSYTFDEVQSALDYIAYAIENGGDLRYAAAAERLLLFRLAAIKYEDRIGGVYDRL